MENNNCIKIVVLGAESTGKTALCEALAKHYNTVFVPEYAREYFRIADIHNYTIKDLLEIAKKQEALELDMAKDANRILFCDTNIITLKIWSLLEFSTIPQYVHDLIKQLNSDFYLLTNNDIVWTKDPLRFNKFDRDLILNLNLEEIKKTEKPYAILRGEGEKRISDAIQTIDTWLKRI